MPEVITIIDDLESKTKHGILSLLAETYDKRNGDYEVSSRAQKVGISSSRIFVDLGDRNAARELYKRYGSNIDIATIALLIGEKQDARNSIMELINSMMKEFNHDYNHLSAPKFFSTIAEVFFGNELERLIQPLIEITKERFDLHSSLRNDVLTLEAFLAYRLGRQDKVNEIYNERKRKSEKINEENMKLFNKKGKKGEKYYEMLENMSYVEMGDEDSHATFCEVTGKYEEAIHLRIGGINQQLLLEEPLSSALDKLDKELRENICESILHDETLFNEHPNFMLAAKASEKLGRNASEYYQRALVNSETNLRLWESFTIAKKLNLEQKVKTYTDLVTYLYEHRHI